MVNVGSVARRSARRFALAGLLGVVVLAVTFPLWKDWAGGMVLESLDKFDDGSGAAAAMEFIDRTKSEIRPGMHADEVIAFAERMTRDYPKGCSLFCRNRGEVWYYDNRQQEIISIRGRFWPPWGWTVFVTIGVRLDERNFVVSVGGDVLRDG